MNANIVRRLAALGMAAAVVALAGCATGAHKENMAVAPAAAAPAKKFPHTIRVETRGGADTGVMDSSNVANADLKAAIEASIAKSGLFKSVVQGAGGDYELTVSITHLDKPTFGASFTVNLDAAWTLVKVSDKSVVLRKPIKSTYTGGFADSLVGVTRLRLAVEGAVRNNISEGLQAIAQLPL